MREVVFATFDGARIVAESQLHVPVNARVRVIVETVDDAADNVYPDVEWYEHFDEYLWPRHEHPVH
jgi:hypothetical protein